MKILFVSAVLPYPLHSGGQIRIYNLLKRLSKKHEIHLYSFIRTDGEKKYLSHLSFCKKVIPVMRGRVWQPGYVLKSMTGAYPLLWESYHNSEMESLLADEMVTGRYDLVHIEPGYVWPSLPTVGRVPIVIAEHNVEHEVYKAYVAHFPIPLLRPFLSIDIGKMKYWEKRAWTEAGAIVSVSQRDKDVIGMTIDAQKVSVVPNGVDLDQFVFLPKKQLIDALTILYVGNFAWMENKDAVEHIIGDFWPAIIHQYPKAKLRIVGKNMPKSFEKFKSSNISFWSNVDVITDELNGADIMFAPIRVGGGTKYKILEAMAAGLPVITSSTGVLGMDVHHGKELLIADTIQDVLKSIEELRNQKKRLHLVNAARKCIEERYSWDTIAQSLEKVWQKIYEAKH